MTQSSSSIKNAYNQLDMHIQRSECSICHTTNAECIIIDTEEGTKSVCAVCSNAIILKLIKIQEITAPVQKHSISETPTQKQRKHKNAAPKVKPLQMSLEELIQHQYYEMFDLGVPISQIAIVLKIPIETLQAHVEKWEEEDRIKENKDLQNSKS